MKTNDHSSTQNVPSERPIDAPLETFSTLEGGALEDVVGGIQIAVYLPPIFGDFDYR